MSTLFDLAFLLAAPFWLLMVFAPGWTWTRRVVSSPLIVLPTLVVWAIAAAPVFGDLVRVVLRPDLAGLRDLLASDAAITALWAQVIAWDLFVGRWVYLDSRERGISGWITGPLLVVTVLLSPVAVPVYFALRRFFAAGPGVPATGAVARPHSRGGATVAQGTGVAGEVGSGG